MEGPQCRYAEGAARTVGDARLKSGTAPAGTQDVLPLVAQILDMAFEKAEDAIA
jgi:hypothetical protein